MAIIEDAVAATDIKSKTTASHACHNSLFMGRMFPTGMIFASCKEGISHESEEFFRPADIANGVDALAHILAELALVKPRNAVHTEHKDEL